MCRNLWFLPPFKKKRKNMKKFYIAPEVEEILLMMDQALLAGSPETDDITDGPTPTDENPSDDDLEW